MGDALSDRGHEPHHPATVRRLRFEAMLGTYPMLDTWHRCTFLSRHLDTVSCEGGKEVIA